MFHLGVFGGLELRPALPELKYNLPGRKRTAHCIYLRRTPHPGGPQIEFISIQLIGQPLCMVGYGAPHCNTPQGAGSSLQVGLADASTIGQKEKKIANYLTLPYMCSPPLRG